MWDTLLSDDEILALGQCKAFRKGNILPWEKKWITNHGALVTDVNPEIFCKEEVRFIVFAKRQSRLLGGSVLVCKNKKILLKRLSLLLREKVNRLEQAKIGQKRMGESGASKKIVDAINLHLLS